MTSTLLRLVTLAALTLGTTLPALAQDGTYSRQDRIRDDLQRPYELDGLGLGTGAPFLSSDDLGLSAENRRAGGFELEGPPIYPALPVLPAERLDY